MFPAGRQNPKIRPGSRDSGLAEDLRAADLPKVEESGRRADAEGAQRGIAEGVTSLSRYLHEGRPLEESAEVLGQLEELIAMSRGRQLTFMSEAVALTKKVIEDLLAGRNNYTGLKSIHVPALMMRIDLEHQCAQGLLSSPETTRLFKLRELLSFNPERVAEREREDSDFQRMRRQTGVVRVATHRSLMWHGIFETVIDDYIESEIPPRRKVMFPPEKLRELFAQASCDVSASSWLGRQITDADPYCLRQLEETSALFRRYAEGKLPSPYDPQWRTVRRELRWGCDILKANYIRVVRAPFDGGMMHPLLDEFWGMTPWFVIKPEYPHEDDLLLNDLQFQIFNSTKQHGGSFVFEPPESIWKELEDLQREWLIDPARKERQAGLEKIFGASLLKQVFSSTSSRLIVTRLNGKLGGFSLVQVGRNGLLPDKEENLKALEKAGEAGGPNVAWIYLALASKAFIRAGVGMGFDAHGWQTQLTTDIMAAEGIEAGYGRVRIGEQGNAAMSGHGRVGARRLAVFVPYKDESSGKGYISQIVALYPLGTVAGRAA